jgi:hypothetical protein
VFVLGRPFQPSPIFASKVRPYSSAPFRFSRTIGKAPDLTHKRDTRLERLAKTNIQKHFKYIGLYYWNITNFFTKLKKIHIQNKEKLAFREKGTSGYGRSEQMCRRHFCEGTESRFFWTFLSPYISSFRSFNVFLTPFYIDCWKGQEIFDLDFFSSPFGKRHHNMVTATPRLWNVTKSLTFTTWQHAIIAAQHSIVYILLWQH